MARQERIMEHSLTEMDIPTMDPLDVLRNGIAAAKAGNRAAARSLLLEAARMDPYNELPWLWLAWAAESPKEALFYVDKVLEINPSNQQANDWMSKLQKHRTQEESIWRCPLCLISLQTQVEKCPRCRAVLTLNDIEVLLENGDADRNLIRQAVERYQELPEEDFDFTIHFNLGMAYINEKQFDEGIRHLRAASRLHPADGILRSQVQVVERKTATTREKDREGQRQKIILVIDDSPTVRKIVAVTLERHGYKVVIAPDGVQALAKLEEAAPDLVLLDINMPYMDGHQVCKVLKGNNSTKQVPVVMLSGKDGFMDKVRARMSGATEFISKPVDPNALLVTVQKYLKSNERM